jgi:hypothetical protein
MDGRIIAGVERQGASGTRASACKGGERTKTADLGENKANINLANVLHLTISTCYTKNI